MLPPDMQGVLFDKFDHAIFERRPWWCDRLTVSFPASAPHYYKTSRTSSFQEDTCPWWPIIPLTLLKQKDVQFCAWREHKVLRLLMRGLWRLSQFGPPGVDDWTSKKNGITNCRQTSATFFWYIKTARIQEFQTSLVVPWVCQSLHWCGHRMRIKLGISISVGTFCINYKVPPETASIMVKLRQARRLRVEQFELSLVRTLYSAV
jgi:hypothetical protein